MLWYLKDLMDFAKSCQKCINGKWVPCRPVGPPMKWRLKAAWLVLTGKADAVIWPNEQ